MKSSFLETANVFVLEGQRPNPTLRVMFSQWHRSTPMVRKLFSFATQAGALAGSAIGAAALCESKTTLGSPVATNRDVECRDGFRC